ncbi:MAG TPA: gliding motility-associated C-terminal domain-containing protein [Saprospiraceae bacterium]|nr:gliding motility-associated C-terminal domain-containing protein [Saprospiraceae bacterium]
MKKILLVTIIFFCLGHLFSQVIYLSTTDTSIYRLNIVTCDYSEVVKVVRALTDISFHPDGTLYGVDGGGNLFEIDTMNGATTVVHHFNGLGQIFNSLTTSAEGIIYSTGSEGRLFTYDKTNDQADYLGNFGYKATGDLTFYKGNLYAAAEFDRIILIDLSNLANSYIAVDENILGKEVFGIVSYSQSCDSIKCYAISSGDSDIYEIDFISESFQPVCHLNIRVGGGASTYEFFGSSPIAYDGVISTNPACNSNNGSILINATGGVAPLTYSINGIDFQTSNTFNNLAGGNYQFIISDKNGCTIIEEVSLLTTNGPVIEDIGMVPATCGNSNGEIDVSVNGGNGMIVYSIDGLNFQPSPVFNNLNLGQYFVTIRDTAGCIAIDSIDITSLSLDTIEGISASLVSCDVTAGSLVIQVSNAIGITYSLDGINFQVQNQFDQLSPGTYLITIQNANGCRDTMSAVIYPPAVVQIDQVTVVDPICGDNEGSLQISATGGTGQIFYSIDGVNFQTDNHFDHLAPSGYVVIIRDENGCLDNSSALIQPGVALLIDTIQTDSSHCTLQDGSILVTPEGGTGQIQYSIDGINFQDENLFDLLAPALYHITIMDENGCIDSVVAVINSINSLFIGNIESIPPRCDVNDGSIIVTPVGGIGQVQFSLDGINFQTDNRFSDLGSGNYIIEIQDAAGCKANAPVGITEPLPLIIKAIETQTAACEENTGSIIVTISGGTGLITISLDGGAFQTTSTFQNLNGGLHELIITDENGCQVDTTVRIGKQRCKIYIPNSFSPNGDGFNDLFQLSTSDDINIQITKYMIFDRWGNMVYKADDFPIASTQFWWDGTFKKMSVNPGVFAYYIEVKFEDGGNEIFKGDVTLFR